MLRAAVMSGLLFVFRRCSFRRKRKERSRKANTSRPSGGSTWTSSPSPPNRRPSTWLLARGPARRRNTGQVRNRMVQYKNTYNKDCTYRIFVLEKVPIYLFIYSIYLYSHRVGWLSMHVLVRHRPVSHIRSYPVIRLSIHPSVHPSIVCLSIHPTTYPSIDLRGSFLDKLPVGHRVIF